MKQRRSSNVRFATYRIVVGMDYCVPADAPPAFRSAYRELYWTLRQLRDGCRDLPKSLRWRTRGADGGPYVRDRRFGAGRIRLFATYFERLPTTGSRAVGSLLFVVNCHHRSPNNDSIYGLGSAMAKLRFRRRRRAHCPVRAVAVPKRRLQAVSAVFGSTDALILEIGGSESFAKLRGPVLALLNSPGDETGERLGRALASAAGGRCRPRPRRARAVSPSVQTIVRGDPAWKLRLCEIIFHGRTTLPLSVVAASAAQGRELHRLIGPRAAGERTVLP